MHRRYEVEYNLLSSIQDTGTKRRGLGRNEEQREEQNSKNCQNEHGIQSNNNKAEKMERGKIPANFSYGIESSKMPFKDEGQEVHKNSNHDKLSVECQICEN